MDVLKIYSDSDFENAVVPEGMILSFPALLDGKLVTRYKNSSGAFGTLAGGSIEGDAIIQNLTENHSIEIGFENAPLETENEVTDDDGNTVYQTDENGEQILDDEGNPIPKTETERAFQCFVRGSGNSYGSSVTIDGDNNENSLGFVRIYGSNNKTYQFQNIFGDLNELTASVNVTVFGNSNKDNGKNANGAVIIGNLNEVTAANTFTAGYRVKNFAKGARAFGRYFTLEDTPENEYAFALGDGELDGTTPTGEISLIHRVFKAAENPLFNPDSPADDSDASDPNPKDSSGERKYVAERAYATEYRGHWLAVTRNVDTAGTVTLDHDQYARWNLTASGTVTLALANWQDGDSGELIIDTTKQVINIPAEWVTLGADITTTPGVYVLEIAQIGSTIYYAVKYPDSGGLTVDSALSGTSTNPVQNKVINTALAAKAPLASPTFTGTPKVPTASAGTNTTQAASTAFVTTAVANGTASKANDSAVVHLAGAETITGQKTFTANPIYSGDQPKYIGVGANLTKGTSPSTDKTFEMIFCDKNGTADANKVASFALDYTADGDVRAGLRAFKGASGSTLSSFFHLVYPASGSPYITTDAVVDPDCGSLIGTIQKSGNGYVIFPNGLIIQWGSAYIYDEETSIDVTFPVTFTNTPRVVSHLSCTLADRLYQYESTSKVTFRRYETGYTAIIDYIAIGY